MYSGRFSSTHLEGKSSDLPVLQLSKALSQMLNVQLIMDLIAVSY